MRLFPLKIKYPAIVLLLATALAIALYTIYYQKRVYDIELKYRNHIKPVQLNN